MTRKEAMEYNDALKTEMEQVALRYGFEESVGSRIVDNYIIVLPEDARRGMIFLGKNSVSYKLGNIKIDLKNIIEAGFEFVVSINTPESIFDYIQLVIVSILFIQKRTKKILNSTEAYIVYLLHKKDAYKICIEEQRFISELQDLYQKEKGEFVDSDTIINALNNLYKMKIIDSDNGKIYLKEFVWGKV